MEREVIPIASDHPGVELKKELIKHLSELGYQPLDLGTHSSDRVDYPSYGLSVADKVSKNQYARGIVICKTGVGMSIVANKLPNIRAGLVTSPEIAELAKKHNNINILALGAEFTSIEKNKEIVRVWLETKPEGGRHQQRIEQISIIERNNLYSINKEYSPRQASSIRDDHQRSDVKITASLMCANQLNMIQDINQLIESGIDMFHIDILDGLFAANISLNIEHIHALRKQTSIPIDVHLMVKDPSIFISRIAAAGADLVLIHVESECDINAALEKIKLEGMQSGLVLEVDTPVEKLYHYLDKVDLVMFMCVYTGFKATPFVPKVIEKIKQLENYNKENNLNIPIMVDGSISPKTIPQLYLAGARIFVGGTSGLFKEGGFKENLIKMRTSANNSPDYSY